MMDRKAGIFMAAGTIQIHAMMAPHGGRPVSAPMGGSL